METVIRRLVQSETESQNDASSANLKKGNDQALENFKFILTIILVILIIFLIFFVYNIIKCYLPKWRRDTNRQRLENEKDVEMD
jgi:hypothetical protein